MLVSDLREIPKDHPIDADVCIIGSGPAGATLAAELDASNITVLLLESGGLGRQPDTDALNEIENIGWPRETEQWFVRNRILGGSSATWGGRCVPLDQIDYQVRDWVPYSGWPIRFEDITPYLVRAAPYVGLETGAGVPNDESWLAKRRKQPPAVNQQLLVPFFWQFGKDAKNPFDLRRFANGLMALDGNNIKILTNATATHINTNEDGTMVESVEARCRDGATQKVYAPCIVLCGGGIENPRLLLASNRTVAAGLGNQNDLVGRFLMDHPRGIVGGFDPHNSETLQKWFGTYNVRGKNGNIQFRHGFRLSPDFQEKNGLLNCAVFLEDVLAENDPWNALKGVLRGRASARNAMIIASNAGLFARGIYSYFRENNGLPRKLDRLNLTCIVEQRPNPESRVTLADRTDRFGTPLSRIDWRTSDQEGQTVKAAARLVAAEFKRLGLVEPQLEDWVVNDEGLHASFKDHAHPSGATRMSASPDRGVVDPHCEVHGVRGLFVAGSSVFPTVGHANPTQMIVAMAVRLADKLKQRFANREHR